MKQDLAHGQGIGYSLFGGQGFAKGDSQAILNFNTALKNGVAPAKAWAKNMSNASIAAQNATRDTIKTKGSLTDLANGLKATSVGAKAASVGLKALSVAGNMLLIALISQGVSWLLTFNQRLEESRQEMIASGKEAAQLTKDLDGLVEQYRKLGSDGKFDNSDREQARSIQEQINALLGDEAHYIDLSNGGYEHQLKLLRKLQHEQANAKYATIKDAKETAEASLRRKISNIGVGNNIAKAEVEAIEKLSRLPEMDKYLKTYEGDEKGRGKFAMFNVDTSSTEAMITSYEKMIELRNILSKSYADEIKKGGSLEDFYNNLTDEIDELSDAVTKYKDAIDDYNINEAVVQFNETDFGGIKGALIDSEEKMKSWAKAMVESEDISDGIKENLIGLAKTYYPDLSNAINESVQAHYKEKYAKAGSSSEIGNHIKNLDAEADQCGLTKKAYIDLISTEILFNNNNLNITQKISSLQQLAYQAGITADKMREVLMVDSLQKAYDTNTYGIEAAYRAGRITKEERDNRKAQILSELNASLYEGYEDTTNTGTSPYSLSDDDKGKDNTPDYKDPTEAIINRINLRANELEQQEEYIQNALEIAEIENDYEKQISLTNDKLAVQKQKVDALKTANDELHQMAEDLRNSTPDWNEEEWFDSQGNATEVYNTLYNNSSKEEQEKLENQFEKISKIKKAWIENDEERLSLTKEILQTEEDVVNLDYGHSQDWIDERNTYNDWALFNDSEIDAWERVIKRLKEDYKDCAGAAEKLKEAEENLFEARKEQFDKANDFASSYIDSKKTVLQSYYDATNDIAEAQHEINKELETSKTMYEWLDEDTRKLLFNQEDYNELSEELLDIQYKADKLQRQYTRDLENSTLETVESITSQYEMQYEMLMKSYEIAKADLEIAKKKQHLNNVLNERNVRMFINGQWQWVANTEDVANAKSELADAEYAKRVEEAGLTQQESINNLTKRQDELGVVIKQFENGVVDLDSAIRLARDAIGSIPSALSSMYRNVSLGGVLYSGTDSSAGSGNSVDSAPKRNPIAANKSGVNISTIYLKQKHAKGTGYTQSGSMLVGEEEPEIYIDSNGHFIPINQPTIFTDVEAGGKVFNSIQMQNLESLWNLSNMNPSHSLPSMIERTQTVTTIDNSIHINGMTISEQSNEDWIAGLKRHIAIHR